jgi:heme-degrading monooxygenase HmoA
MFVVINDLYVTPENHEVFERNFAAGMHATLPDVPGLLAARLLAPAQPDRGYLSLIEFTDEAAYSAYLESDNFRAAHQDPKRHAPIDGSRLTTYQVRTEVTGTPEPVQL